MRYMVCLAMFSVLAWRDDARVTVPLTGLMAGCCEEPVKAGLKGIEGVSKVDLRKTGSGYEADLALKEGSTVTLAALAKALEEPNRTMGADMGTKCAVGESLSAAYVHFYRTGAAPNEDKLKTAFSKLDGYKALWTAEGGFGVAFTGKSIPSLADVRKAGGVEITDVILALSKDGFRFTCRKHPDQVRLAEGECPVCKAKLEKVAAGDVPPPTPNAGEAPKKGCGC